VDDTRNLAFPQQAPPAPLMHPMQLQQHPAMPGQGLPHQAMSQGIPQYAGMNPAAYSTHSQFYPQQQQPQQQHQQRMANPQVQPSQSQGLGGQLPQPQVR